MSTQKQVGYLKRHMNDEYLQRLSSMSLSSAAFSAGIILFVVDSNNENNVAPGAAITSLLAGLFGWQYILPYMLFKEKSYDHIQYNLIALIQTIVVIALLIAVVSIILPVYKCAGIVLTIVGVILMLAVFLHNLLVQDYCINKDDENKKVQ